jgi:energy-coupling factor transporter ATP-binding protein EcfA2
LINELSISNYKTVVQATIPIGRFTVLIGENGAGKSNVLEALVLGSAASSGKLDRELLIGRGIRVTPPDLMKSAFTSENKRKPINISVTHSPSKGKSEKFEFTITHDGEPYSDWKLVNSLSLQEKMSAALRAQINSLPEEKKFSEIEIAEREIKKLFALLKPIEKPSPSKSPGKDLQSTLDAFEIKSSLLAHAFDNLLRHRLLEKFTVYAPDYYTLRNFVPEGQTAPLGTRGEGLLKLLASMHEKEPERIHDIDEGLGILGWYKGIDIKKLTTTLQENRLLIKDKFIRRRGLLLDQVSTNEGFLFCLFYLTLFASSSTPQAFAIENIENGLNPKLCEQLVKNLKHLSKKYNKQAIISTHSPSVLDALNLDAEDELLLAVDRNLDGHTRINKINKPRSNTGKITRLSEAFLMGQLGGLPRNFA